MVTALPPRSSTPPIAAAITLNGVGISRRFWNKFNRQVRIGESMCDDMNIAILELQKSVSEELKSYHYFLQDGKISYDEFAAMMQTGTDWRKASRHYSRGSSDWISFDLLVCKGNSGAEDSMCAVLSKELEDKTQELRRINGEGLETMSLEELMRLERQVEKGQSKVGRAKGDKLRKEFGDRYFDTDD